MNYSETDKEAKTQRLCDDHFIREPEYLTPQELAAKLNMSLKWVTKHTQARRIPGQVKIGRLWRYNRIQVEKRLLSGRQFLLDR